MLSSNWRLFPSLLVNVQSDLLVNQLMMPSIFCSLVLMQNACVTKKKLTTSPYVQLKLCRRFFIVNQLTNYSPLFPRTARNCVLNDGSWHHVCVSLQNTSRLFIYRDGINVHRFTFRFSRASRDRHAKAKFAYVYLGKRPGKDPSIYF